jgi:hypothetical protein
MVMYASPVSVGSPFLVRDRERAPYRSVPDPIEDAQALEDLEHETTTLAADIHAATHRMPVLLALERCVRAWKHLSRKEEASLEGVNYRRRRLSVFLDESGAYVVRGVVTAEVGALLIRAVEAASDALFSAEAKDETTPEQRRADALGLLAPATRLS